jgi:hypothetical protein
MTRTIHRTPPIALLAIAALLTIAGAYALGALFDLGGALPGIVAPLGIGAVTLAQAALLSDDDLQRGVLEIFVQESVVLDRIPFKNVEEATLPGVEFRAVNAAYSETTGTVNQKTEALTIIGGDADVDTFIQQTRGNVNDQRATQDRMKVKALSYAWQNALINGDVAVDANSFDGLKKRLTGAQVLSHVGINGGPIVGNGGTDAHAFFDDLEALLALVPGISGDNGALYMNSTTRSKILSAMRRLNISIEPIGRLPAPIRASVTSSTRINQAQLPTYNGIPLIDIGTKGDNTLILPNTETLGTSTDCSSIYAVRFGESEGDQAVTGLSNGGVSVRDLGELQTKPALRTRIEFFSSLAIFGGKAAARMQGVRPS